MQHRSPRGGAGHGACPLVRGHVHAGRPGTAAPGREGLPAADGAAGPGRPLPRWAGPVGDAAVRRGAAAGRRDRRGPGGLLPRRPGPDPERVAGMDLGLIHPYAVAGPERQGLLVPGRAIRGVPPLLAGRRGPSCAACPPGRARSRQVRGGLGGEAVAGTGPPRTPPGGQGVASPNPRGKQERHPRRTYEQVYLVSDRLRCFLAGCLRSHPRYETRRGLRWVPTRAALAQGCRRAAPRARAVIRALVLLAEGPGSAKTQQRRGPSCVASQCRVPASR